MSKNLEKGSLYLEALISLFLIGISSIYFLPWFPELIKRSQMLNRATVLQVAAEYVGNYLLRWSCLTEVERPSLDSYDSSGDGVDMNLRDDTSIFVNRLQYAIPLNIQRNSDFKNQYKTYFTDEYKTSITFWETASRQGSVVAVVKVWFDTNLNSLMEDGEPFIQFSLVLSDKSPFLHEQ
jgi:hypothetical protein